MKFKNTMNRFKKAV